MKILITLLWTLLAIGLTNAQSDNTELADMYRLDQKDRTSGTIDWAKLTHRDSLRRVRLRELLNADKLQTANDHYHAAMIFQHGNDTIASGMAIQRMEKAIQSDSTMNKWLLAAAIDRDLMRKGKPQIYGTQYIMDASTGNKFALYQIDTTIISDHVRRAYNVRTLAEQREEVARLNKKKLHTLVPEMSGQGLVNFIKAEFKKTATSYDLSEMTINSLGYHYLNNGDLNIALQLFELNTIHYPDSGNTWDSYGEALLKDGQKSKAREAYGKSVQLDPNNEHGRKVLEQLGERRKHN